MDEFDNLLKNNSDDGARVIGSEISDDKSNRNKKIGYILIAIVLVSTVAGIVLIATGMIDTRVDDFWTMRESVAVIHVQGPILSGSIPGGFGFASSEDVINSIRDAERDSSVKAIILRVNSPGGTPAAAQEIVAEMERTEKPIVISMGDIATSGAYWISASADYIMASEDTMTGSIGVIWVIENREAYFEEEGVRYDVFKSGEMKDMGAPWRNLTDEEIELIDNLLMAVHMRFVNTIVEGRGMPINEVKELADGRIFLGADAKELELIDGFGNLYDAIDVAAKLGGIVGEPHVVHMNRPSLARLLFGGEATAEKDYAQYFTRYLEESLHGNILAVPSNQFFMYSRNTMVA